MYFMVQGVYTYRSTSAVASFVILFWTTVFAVKVYAFVIRISERRIYRLQSTQYHHHLFIRSFAQHHRSWGTLSPPCKNGGLGSQNMPSTY